MKYANYLPTTCMKLANVILRKVLVIYKLTYQALSFETYNGVYCIRGPKWTEKQKGKHSKISDSVILRSPTSNFCLTGSANSSNLCTRMHRCARANGHAQVCTCKKPAQVHAHTCVYMQTHIPARSKAENRHIEQQQEWQSVLLV